MYLEYAIEFYLPIFECEIRSIYKGYLNRGDIYDSFNNKYENQVKVIVVGDKDVGKTKLIERFTKNHFISTKVTNELRYSNVSDIMVRVTTVKNKNRLNIFWKSLPA